MENITPMRSRFVMPVSKNKKTPTGCRAEGAFATNQTRIDQRGVGNGSELFASQGLVAQRLTITVVEFLLQVKRIVDANPAAFPASVQQIDAARSTAFGLLRVRSEPDTPLAAPELPQHSRLRMQPPLLDLNREW
ncbi:MULTISPECIES: hypothetical protein [Rhodopseudomonas]|uniref:hypothetical protein n=1 Tax=Rhodopseudomonas TaxID=1073 RepID=UPI0011C058C6|nr:MULTISPECIES: hypothetical protein [Rhodopseudomonas]